MRTLTIPQTPDAVRTIDDARAFYRHMFADVIGGGYHLDTPFREYINGSGDPLFGAEKCEEYEAVADACYEVCKKAGEDPYGIALAQYHLVAAQESAQKALDGLDPFAPAFRAFRLAGDELRKVGDSEPGSLECVNALQAAIESALAGTSIAVGLLQARVDALEARVAV